MTETKLRFWIAQSANSAKRTSPYQVVGWRQIAKSLADTDDSSKASG